MLEFLTGGFTIREFYLVWNESHGAPTVKHPSEGIARGEAERLSRNHPGENFHVLKLVDTCRKNDVVWASGDRKEDVPF